MRAGFFQYDVGRVWEENKRKIEQALKEQNLELIVLPELCSCGYLFESKEEPYIGSRENTTGENHRGFVQTFQRISLCNRSRSAGMGKRKDL